MSSNDEDDGGPTYAAVTSRSDHPGGVNTLFGDGSVRFIKNTINWQTWRGLGTIAGGEVISADSYCKSTDFFDVRWSHTVHLQMQTRSGASSE